MTIKRYPRRQGAQPLFVALCNYCYRKTDIEAGGPRQAYSRIREWGWRQTDRGHICGMCRGKQQDCKRREPNL